MMICWNETRSLKVIPSLTLLMRIREIHPLARLVQNAGTLLPSLIPRCKGTSFFSNTERNLEKYALPDCFSYIFIDI